jgi:hypothetical protein
VHAISPWDELQSRATKDVGIDGVTHLPHTAAGLLEASVDAGSCPSSDQCRDTLAVSRWRLVRVLKGTLSSCQRMEGALGN